MTTTVAETGLAATAFARLEAEGRLLNPVLKAATKKPGRFGFRGELALRFAPKKADEARPPELTCDQVIAVAQEGNTKLPFFAGYLLNFAPGGGQHGKGAFHRVGGHRVMLAAALSPSIRLRMFWKAVKAVGVMHGSRLNTPPEAAQQGLQQGRRPLGAALCPR